MKQQRCILHIDDKDQSAVTDSIQRTLQHDFDLEFISIRTTAPELKKDDSEDMDLDKLRIEIETKIKNKHIDITLTDFDFGIDNFNGTDIVHIVHKLRPKVNFMIYSGNWDKVIRTVVGKDYKHASIEELVNGINDLIHDNIIKCIDRTDYKVDLIKYLRDNTSVH